MFEVSMVGMNGYKLNREAEILYNKNNDFLAK